MPAYMQNGRLYAGIFEKSNGIGKCCHVQIKCFTKMII